MPDDAECEAGEHERQDQRKLFALIDDPTVIGRTQTHLGLPTEVPTARPARPPPRSDVGPRRCRLGDPSLYDADDVIPP